MGFHIDKIMYYEMRLTFTKAIATGQSQWLASLATTYSSSLNVETLNIVPESTESECMHALFTLFALNLVTSEQNSHT